MRWIGLVLAAWWIAAVPASAADAGDYPAIDRICREDESACLLYYGGVARGVVMVQFYALVHGLEPPFCVPEGPILRALGQIVLNYARSHPEEWHFGTGWLAYEAIRGAFPCP